MTCPLLTLFAHVFDSARCALGRRVVVGMRCCGFPALSHTPPLSLMPVSCAHPFSLTPSLLSLTLSSPLLYGFPALSYAPPFSLMPFPCAHPFASSMHPHSACPLSARFGRRSKCHSGRREVVRSSNHALRSVCAEGSCAEPGAASGDKQLEETDGGNQVCEFECRINL